MAQFILHRVVVCKVLNFFQNKWPDKFIFWTFICILTKIWPLNKYHIKGERKEADWSVAKNLLKPKDGGKVKVIEKPKWSFIFEQNHTLL